MIRFFSPLVLRAYRSLTCNLPNIAPLIDPQSPSTSSSSTSSPSAVSVLLNSPTKSSKPQSDPSLHPSSPCSHGSARYAESANVLLRDMSEVVGTGKSVELVEEQEQVEEHMLRLIHSIRYHQAGIVRQTR